jgi:hypothetical protein
MSSSSCCKGRFSEVAVQSRSDRLRRPYWWQVLWTPIRRQPRLDWGRTVWSSGWTFAGNAHVPSIRSLKQLSESQSKGVLTLVCALMLDERWFLRGLVACHSTFRTEERVCCVLGGESWSTLEAGLHLAPHTFCLKSLSKSTPQSFLIKFALSMPKRLVLAWEGICPCKLLSRAVKASP